MGDIIKCYPEFIAAFIPAQLYREVETGVPRHEFNRSPFFLRPDPTGGLPMRSDPTAGPRLKDRIWSPAVIDEIIDNPYDLGGDPKLEISTAESIPAPPEEVVPVGTTAVEETTVEETVVEVTETAVEETIVEMAELQVHQDLAPTRTELRKKLVDELRSLVYEVREAGCPLNPEKLDTFNEINDDTSKGILVSALWEYYGYDNAEGE
jgi:hypothetical protein